MSKKINSDSTPRVSIIVPCYNVESYIARCLDSLLNQTLQDIEIICIDDKSTDNTLKVLTKYKKSDKRIVLITHKKNTGVAIARNDGMDAARGEYIGFVDSDDYVDTDFYEKLYNAAIDTDAEIAKGIIKCINYDGGVYTQNNNARINQSKYNFKTEFTSAIYKNSMLKKHNVTFPIGILFAEDVTFLMKAVSAANKVTTINDTAYIYCRREDSVDSRELSPQHISSGLAVAEHIINWANNQPDMSAIERRHIMLNTYNIITYIASHQLPSVCREKIIASIKSWYTAAGIDSDVAKPKLLKALRKNDSRGISLQLFAQKTRFKLFGKIPLIKYIKNPGFGWQCLLFDSIPLCSMTFGIPKSRFKIFGITILVIKK